MKGTMVALAAVAAACVAGTAGAEPQLRTTARADGSVIHWWLDRREAHRPQGVLVLGQGSGCASVAGNPNIDAAKRLAPGFAVVTVEKYGVLPNDRPENPFEGCRPEFYANHTVSQRVADYQQVLASLEGEPWWDGKLVLFGGSEGGAAMTMLAARAKPDALVVFSTAPGRGFRETFLASAPPPAVAAAEAEFAKIAAAPGSAEVFGGNSYRWWADILDRDLVAELLRVEAPILLVQGELDRSAPVQIARKVPPAFAAAGRCNLTYWELPGLDHHMNDVSGGAHRDEVLGRIASWIASNLERPATAACR